MNRSLRLEVWHSQLVSLHTNSSVDCIFMESPQLPIYGSSLRITAQFNNALTGCNLVQKSRTISRIQGEPIVFKDLPWDAYFDSLLSAAFQNNIPVLMVNIAEPFEHTIAATMHAEDGIYVAAALAYQAIVDCQGYLSEKFAGRLSEDKMCAVVDIKFQVVCNTSLLPLDSKVYSIWPDWRVYPGIVWAIHASGADRWIEVRHLILETGQALTAYYKVKRQCQSYTSRSGCEFLSKLSPLLSSEIMSEEFFRELGIPPSTHMQQRVLQGNLMFVERRCRIDTGNNIRCFPVDANPSMLLREAVVQAGLLEVADVIRRALAEF
jgi:hypothetical protein